MIKVYFVRHAQPDHSWSDDRTRPLTKEGKEDSKKVLKFLEDKNIHRFYCSPYKRSVDTIASAAELYGEKIIIDERLHERISGPNANSREMIQRRWDDLDFHEDGGESIRMVQQRNIRALFDILSSCSNKSNNEDINVVIGTHGTALSSILNFFDPSFDILNPKTKYLYWIEETLLSNLRWHVFEVLLGRANGDRRYNLIVNYLERETLRTYDDYTYYLSNSFLKKLAMIVQ